MSVSQAFYWRNPAKGPIFSSRPVTVYALTALKPSMSCPYVNLSEKIRIFASVITINENAMTIIANPVYDTVFKFLMEDEKTNKNQLDYVNILHNLCVEEEILTALENRNTKIKEKEQLIEQKDQVIKARKLLLVSMLRKQGRSNEEIAILLHLTEEEVDKLLGTEE